MKVKGRADSIQEQANILDVVTKSFELSDSVTLCLLSVFVEYLTLINIFGGNDGARLTAASKCDVLEAYKEAIQTQMT